MAGEVPDRQGCAEGRQRFIGGQEGLLKVAVKCHFYRRIGCFEARAEAAKVLRPFYLYENT